MPHIGVLSEELDVRDLERLASFIHGYSGIKLPASKKTMIEGRLRRRLRALGIPSFKDYCRYVFEEGGLKAEAVHLIDAVTTNKTDFFREPEHFDLLISMVLPALLTRAQGGTTRPLKLWSAACSIGAEPYTLAMVLAEAARAKPGLRYSIFASDICTEVLYKAVEGIFPEDMAAPIPPEMRQRYLMHARDPNQDRVRIVPELRQQVHFARINLMDETYAVADDMDVVFCRNILIYFDKETQEAVLRGLCRHIRLGGFLFIGHSESLGGQSLPLHQVASTVFQRI
ncbi:MAG TPA: CheR family methyltransferase [Patescibacteria group bacterium]|nr:CheR family methyltransferase [Patescibacteria group bacterium]